MRPSITIICIYELIKEVLENIYLKKKKRIKLEKRLTSFNWWYYLKNERKCNYFAVSLLFNQNRIGGDFITKEETVYDEEEIVWNSNCLNKKKLTEEGTVWRKETVCRSRCLVLRLQTVSTSASDNFFLFWQLLLQTVASSDNFIFRQFLFQTVSSSIRRNCLKQTVFSI